MPGLYEFCMQGQHDQCEQRDCRCLCHPWAQKLVKSAPKPQSSSVSGTLICPNCAKSPRTGDQFCRADGTKLIAGKQCRCGKGAEPSDEWCGGCGQKFGLPPIPALELSEEEIAALEARARMRPSDVEVPPVEVQ